MEEDQNYKEILKSEVKVLKMIEVEMKEANDNIKTRKIDETLSYMKNLRDKVVRQNKILSVKIGNNENYKEETGDTIEILGCVEVILARLENAPKNKFRKVFEEIMQKKVIEEVKEIVGGKQAVYWGLYDENEF